MNKHNPHACTALDAPFPVHGGEYTSTGRDLARVQPPAAPAAPDDPAPASEPPAGTEPESAARRGSKKREE